MKYFFVFALILSGLLATGCVSSKFSYKPPEAIIPIENKVVVSGTKETVWVKLVQGIGTNFFVINNMDKQSGFINVSYVGDPEKYVYGGDLHFYISNARGERNYDFPAARSFTQYEKMMDGSLCSITRKLDLEGRMNVLVNEVDSAKVSVTVNTRYILSLNVTGSDVMGHYIAPRQETISFNTGQSAKLSGGTMFYSNGELEKTIINLVK